MPRNRIFYKREEEQSKLADECSRWALFESWPRRRQYDWVPSFFRPSTLTQETVEMLDYLSKVSVASAQHYSRTILHCDMSVYCTGLFKMIVGVLHNTLQMQPLVVSFYGVTSRIRFMFLLFPQVSRNWRYESEPPLKPSPLTSYKQFGTNSIIVLMFVESQRVHI